MQQDKRRDFQAAVLAACCHCHVLTSPQSAAECELGLEKDRELYLVCERIFWIRQGVSRKMERGFSACQERRKLDTIMESQNFPLFPQEFCQYKWSDGFTISWLPPSSKEVKTKPLAVSAFYSTISHSYKAFLHAYSLFCSQGLTCMAICCRVSLCWLKPCEGYK